MTPTVRKQVEGESSGGRGSRVTERKPRDGTSEQRPCGVEGDLEVSLENGCVVVGRQVDTNYIHRQRAQPGRG